MQLHEHRDFHLCKTRHCTEKTYPNLFPFKELGLADTLLSFAISTMLLKCEARLKRSFLLLLLKLSKAAHSYRWKLVNSLCFFPHLLFEMLQHITLQHSGSHRRLRHSHLINTSAHARRLVTRIR